MDVAFWQKIVDSYYQLPPDSNLIDLTSELMQHLGASDPLLRDTYAYNILSRWITLYDYHTPDELRQMIDWLLPRLQHRQQPRPLGWRRRTPSWCRRWHFGSGLGGAQRHQGQHSGADGGLLRAT